MPSATLPRLAALATILFIGLPSAEAQTTYTWDAGGAPSNLWSTATNWVGDTVPSFAAGETFDLGALNTVTNSTSTVDFSATLGAIRIGDAVTSSNTWLLNSANAAVLTLDNGASAATITQTATSFGDTISVPLALKGGLTITNSSATKALAISGSITSTATGGTQTIRTSGTTAGAITLGGFISDGSSGGTVAVTHQATGTLTLSGANTYTGVTTVGTAGTTLYTLSVTNPLGLGSNVGGTTVNAGGTTTTGTRLLLGAAITVTNETLTMATGTAGQRTALSYAGSTGTATWAGNVVITGTTGTQFYSETSGGTLVVGLAGINTVTGTASLSLRGEGSGTMNSAINLGAGTASRTDSGIWTVNSSGNVWSSFQLSAGVVTLGTTDALATTGMLIMGQGSGGSPIFNLAGKGQTVAGLSDTAGNTSATITSTVAGSVFTVNNATASAYGANKSVIAGGVNLSLVKVGAGTLTLNGINANSYTGTTSVIGGTLLLNFANMTTPTNLINSGSALVLGGGTFSVSAKSGTATAQTVGGLIVNRGASAITVVSSATDTLLALQGINRAAGGGTVAFTLPAGTQTATNGVTTTAPLVNNVLGGWATVGDDWASKSGDNVVSFTTAGFTYADVDRLGGTLPNDATANVRLVEGGAGTTVTVGSPGSTSDIYTLLQSAAGGTATIDLGSGDVLRLGVAGGVLMTGTAGPLTFGSVLGQGTLTAGGAAATAGGLSFTNNSAANAITVNSLIADNGAAVTVTKAGVGPMVLNAANTYTGGTSLGGGTLTLGTGATLGSANGTLTVTGGTLMLNGNSIGVGTITGGGGTILNNAAGNLTLTLGNGNVSGGNFYGVIGNGTEAGTVALAKVGTGLTALSGTNTYTGGTTLTAGTLSLGSAGALGTSGAINFNGGTLQLTPRGAPDLSARFTATAGQAYRIDISGGGQIVTLAGNLTGNAGLSLNGVSTTNTNSTLVLTGNNSALTGNVTVTAGGIRITNSNGLGTGTKTVTLNNGTAGNPNLQLDGGAGDIVLPASISFVTSNATNQGPIINLAGNNTINGNFTLTGGGGSTWLNSLGGFLKLTGTFTPDTAGRTLNLKGVGDGEISGLIQDGSAANTLAVLKDNGPGTWTLSGVANAYSLATTVTAGTLAVAKLADGGVVSSIGKSANVAGSLVVNGGTLRYVGGGDTTNRLFTIGGVATLNASGTGAVNFTNAGALAYSAAGTRTLALTGSNAGDNTLTPVVADNTGATSVTKAGVGAWVLAGANTYTGATTVTAGSLYVTGTHSGAGNYAVTGSASGATILGGTGAVTLGGTNTLAVSGPAPATRGAVAPGTPATLGTLAVNGGNGVVFGSNSELRIRLSGATSDRLAVGTSLDLSGSTDAITIVGNADGVSSYVVATYGTLNGTFDTVNNLPSGYSLDYSAPGSIVLSPVPEPPTVLGLAAVGLGFSGWVRRRRTVGISPHASESSPE